MLHGPAAELKEDKSIVRKTRLGLWLFFIYLAIYAGFVIIATFFPSMMGAEVLGGQNLAVVYGMTLIVLALVMGLIYNFFCNKYEQQMNEEDAS
ncbi:MAG: DUF485 domain-containing protein [Bacteroidales bacterium]|jgi:uncharacterized membrane protein (DUF485 family)|nr:DUF485 domain-containing protein [Bacteroidales bacterium]